MVTKGIVFLSSVLFTYTLLWTSINTCIYIQTLYSKQEWKSTYIISKTVLSCMSDDQTRPICIVYLLCSFRNSNDDIFNINNHIFSNHRCILLQIEIFF